jgi:hypothetical protein
MARLVFFAAIWIIPCITYEGSRPDLWRHIIRNISVGFGALCGTDYTSYLRLHHNNDPVTAVFASLLAGSHVSQFAPAIQLYGLSTYFHYLSLYVMSVTNTSDL